jgi:hypothetical protein
MSLLRKDVGLQIAIAIATRIAFNLTSDGCVRSIKLFGYFIFSNALPKASGDIISLFRG